MYRIALYGLVTRNPSVSDTFLCHLQIRSLFVPDSQWNVYRIARHRVTDRRIWYKMLSDTKGIRYRVTEAPNIKFIVKKENNMMLAILDVCINNKDPSCLLASLHPRNTFTRLLNNFFSVSSFSYKIGVIRTLVGRAYKINNTLLNFNEDVNKLYFIFKKISIP